jgi:cellulose synthase (UDP-forming)
MGILANIALGKGRFKPIETERYNLLKMMTFIKASFALVGLEPKSFVVTPKAASKGLGSITQIIWPFYAIMVVLAASMVIGGLRLVGFFGGTEGNFTALATSEGWALYNLFIIAGAIHAVLKHVTRRNTYRFPIHVPVTVQIGNYKLKGFTANVHEQGLGLTLSEPLLEAASVRVTLHLPQKTVEGTLIVRGNHLSNTSNDKSVWYSSGPFTPDTTLAADAIDEFLISIMSRQMQPPLELAASM